MSGPISKNPHAFIGFPRPVEDIKRHYGIFLGKPIKEEIIQIDDEIEKRKYMNGSTLYDVTQNLLFDTISGADEEEFEHITKAIRRFFPSSLTNTELIIAYYTNEFLLQDLIKLEFKKHIMTHIDKIVSVCIRKNNLTIPEYKVRAGVFKYMDDKFKDGLFDGEMAWFLSSTDGGGIFDSSPISDMSDYFEE